MTKPMLLPGGCSFKRGVVFQLFSSQFRRVVCLLLALSGFWAGAADVTLYTVTKGSLHTQDSDGPPVFQPLDEFVFEAKVRCTATTNGATVSSNVRRAFVEASNHIDRNLEQQSPTEWEFDGDENNRHDLNAKYPDGRYRFWIRTVNDGYKTNLSLTLTGAFPSVPRISNYSELQAASGTGFVYVAWEPMANGTAADSIQLRVEDRDGVRVFETRDFGEPGALDGTATHAFIEPGNLQPNTTYYAWLEFRRTTRLNTTTYPGATGWAYTHRRTEFTIRTTASDVLDLEMYMVSKGHHYVQTNLSPPMLVGQGNNGYVFSASLESTGPHLILGNRVIAPNGNTTNLFGEDCRPETQLEFSYVTSSQTGLDNEYPDGVYQFDVTTLNEGSRSMALTLEWADYPPAPHVLNFDPSIPVRTNDALEIRWQPWVGGTSSDFIQLRLLTGCSNVFETGDFGDNDALNGTATSTVIPAGVMIPGETYRATLTFRRFVDFDFTSWPGAAGVASYYSRTRFDVTALLDVEEIELAKGRNYLQTNAVNVVPDGTNAFEFRALVDAQTPISVTGASLSLPDSSSLALQAAPGDDEFLHEAFSSSSLEGVYPPGSYTFTVQTAHDGARTVGLTLPDTAFPPAPRFVHNPVDGVPHDQTNHIVWESWSDGTTSDFVQLRIRNAGTNVWETPDFGEEGALDGTATGAVIPAGVLTQGETYSARLLFRRNVDINTTSYPGSTALAYYFSETEMDLRTIQDVDGFELAKGRNYLQTNAVDVVADGTNAFEFFGLVDAQTPTSISSAFLSLPSGAVLQLQAAPGDDEFLHEAFSSSSLDSTYPPGDYTFAVQTVSFGLRAVTLSLPDTPYPPAPRFLRDPAVRVPHDQTNHIVWEAWSGGTAGDFVQLRIRNAGTNVWETPDFGESGALDGTATSAVIPAGLLVRGETYSARLIFRRATDLDPDSFPGATAVAYYFAQTETDLRTIRPDVEDYGIEKGLSYFQASPTELFPEPGTEYLFAARVQGSGTNLITSAFLALPTGSTNILTADPTFETFERSDFATTNTVFEATYPSGTYEFIVSTRNDGVQSLVLQVPQSVFPPAPRISNFTFSTNSPILAGPAIPLEWDPWAGGTTNDFVQVQIRDGGTNVWETPDFGDPGALDGLATNAVVPAGLLLPGKNYAARVFFRRFVTIDETTVPGSVGTVSFFTRTKFDITTYQPDARSYSLFKGREYVQTNSGPAVPAGYVMEAIVTARTDPEFGVGTLGGGVTLTPPGLSAVALVPDNAEIVFTLRESFATQAELDAAYPDGAYVLDWNGIRYGATNVTLHLTNAAYPDAPHIANYEAAGRVIASQDFILAWDPISNGTPQDYISVVLASVAGGPGYLSPPPSDPAALDGLDTTALIRAATLLANGLYDGAVRVEKLLINDRTTFVEVPGRVGYYSRTSFRAMTAGPGNPPDISEQIEFLPGNQLEFIVNTVPAGAYIIEGSSNLVDWTVLTNFSAISERSTNTMVQPPGSAFFIRAILMR